MNGISHYLYKEFAATHNVSNKIIIYISDESIDLYT